MNYRYKKDHTIDAYGDTENVIHFKFGDARKNYNFTDEFRKEYPNFCKEYTKYFSNEKSLFTDPLAIVNYIDHYGLPVKLYSNYVDEEFADIDACKEWICNECIGRDRGLYNYDGDIYQGLDKNGSKKDE